MPKTRFITALCTPLNEDQSLHREGLEAHLEEQWQSGIAGVLVGGTMGLMQLLAQDTYYELAEICATASAGCGEVLVGVGDASFARTRDRIRTVEYLPIDGVVVVSPYLWRFTQTELVEYYRALADLSAKPVYLYDLPSVTGVKLDLDTVLQAAKHPNVRGIKCSVPWDWTRQLMDCVPARFRVIPAQAQLVDHLIRCGVADNLDGIFGIAPRWTVAIADAAEAGDWFLAARRQQRLSALLRLVTGQYPLFPACTAILNARGIPGNVAPRPMKPLDPATRERLLQEPVVRELLAGEGDEA